MQVPFLDLRRQHREIESEVNSALARVISSGVFILNGEVESFEAEWARFCRVRGAVTTNSGTDALALALIASGALSRGENHEVITTPLTAGYTALAIVSAGGVPVFADVNPRTYTLDPESVEKAISPRTRAIVPVHIYGQMADMEGICQVASRHGLVVIEDAAQAHGAESFGKRAGSYGMAAAFSFYPTKNLGACGDGGAVISNDARLCDQVKSLRQGGHPEALQTGEIGRNSRLDEIQAALLRIKLRHLAEWNLRRLGLADLYFNELAGAEGLILPHASASEAHVYHLFVVQHENREALRAYLTAQGIETMIHYPFLLHQQPLFGRRQQRPLPVAEGLVKRIFSLPLYPQIYVDELLAVSRAICEFEA